MDLRPAHLLAAAQPQTQATTTSTTSSTPYTKRYDSRRVSLPTGCRLHGRGRATASVRRIGPGTSTRSRPSSRPSSAGKRRSLAEWRWRFQEPPSGSATPHVLENEDGIVGHTAHRVPDLGRRAATRGRPGRRHDDDAGKPWQGRVAADRGRITLGEQLRPAYELPQRDGPSAFRPLRRRHGR